jgi:DNA-binding PadR family transcriptional regulator
VSIRDELRKRTGRRIAVGAVYSTMIRLEKRGWVRSSLSDPTPVRGGKAKRVFRVTPAGKRAVEEARMALERLWEGLERREPGAEQG